MLHEGLSPDLHPANQWIQEKLAGQCPNIMALILDYYHYLIAPLSPEELLAWQTKQDFESDQGDENRHYCAI